MEEIRTKPHIQIFQESGFHMKTTVNPVLMTYYKVFSYVGVGPPSNQPTNLLIEKCIKSLYSDHKFLMKNLKNVFALIKFGVTPVFVAKL